MFSDQALALHDRSWVIDGHADTFYEVMDKGHDFFQRQSHGHTDYPRFLAGGVNLQIASLWTPAKHSGQSATDFAQALLDTGRRTIADSRGRLHQVTSQSDLATIAPGQGVLGFCFSIEGATPLQGDVALLEQFYRNGVRAVGLTHNHDSELASGCGNKFPGGLTDAGRRVVARMRELGMLIDIAHLADPGVEEVLDAATQPVVASHALCRSLMPISRNCSDDTLRGIAASGGLIGITFIAQFLRPHEKQSDLHCTIADVCDHLDHAVAIAGIQHVGIGSDFDGYEIPIVGLEDVAALPNLTQELLNRGYTDPDIVALLGGNWLRVLRTVLPVDEADTANRLAGSQG